jgi:hypothetical protein
LDDDFNGSLGTSYASSSKKCGFDSFAMPDLTVRGGSCNASGVYAVCARCNGSTCAGQAVCVRPSDCSRAYFVCYPAGNNVPGA